MNLSSIGQKFHHPDAGLLVLRVVMGFMIFVAGANKLMGGTEMFQQVGGAMNMFGITFGHVFFGLMASLVECLGGLCLLLGVFFRPAAGLLVLVMLVAVRVTWGEGPGFTLASIQDWQMKGGPAVSHLAVFLCLLLTGPGRFALQKGGGGGGASSSGQKPAGK